MKNYKLLSNYFIHIWAVPRDSHLLLGGLICAKLLFYEYLSMLLYKYISKLLPNKYMELNETKAIAGVPRPGSYSLYNYFFQCTSNIKQ